MVVTAIASNFRLLNPLCKSTLLALAFMLSIKVPPSGIPLTSKLMSFKVPESANTIQSTLGLNLSVTFKVSLVADTPLTIPHFVLSKKFSTYLPIPLFSACK